MHFLGDRVAFLYQEWYHRRMETKEAHDKALKDYNHRMSTHLIRSWNKELRRGGLSLERREKIINMIASETRSREHL